MNRFTAPCGFDVDHHRNHFDPSVRAALGLLDRVAEGQEVAERDISLALHVTGDMHEMHTISHREIIMAGQWRRRHALDILREQRHSKSNSLIYLRDRIEDVARRLVREPVNAPQSRTSDCT